MNNGNLIEVIFKGEKTNPQLIQGVICDENGKPYRLVDRELCSRCGSGSIVASLGIPVCVFCATKIREDLEQ